MKRPTKRPSAKKPAKKAALPTMSIEVAADLAPRLNKLTADECEVLAAALQASAALALSYIPLKRPPAPGSLVWN